MSYILSVHAAEEGRERDEREKLFSVCNMYITSKTFKHVEN